jgi:hypothetical protein
MTPSKAGQHEHRKDDRKLILALSEIRTAKVSFWATFVIEVFRIICDYKHLDILKSKIVKNRKNKSFVDEECEVVTIFTFVFSLMFG